LAAGLCPYLLGSLSTPTDLLSTVGVGFGEMEGGERKRVRVREGQEERQFLFYCLTTEYM